MKTRSTRPEESVESSYLQGKLSKITADEVIDFYLVMTLAPSFAGFIAHCQHDRAVGRASEFILLLNPLPPSTPCRRGRRTSLLFCCSSCKRDFIGDYTFRRGVREAILPLCPDCGSSKFVQEVNEETEQ